MKPARKRSGWLLLTPVGEILFSYAKRLLDLNDETTAAVCGAGLEGGVRIGLQEDFGEHLLTETLGRFARSHPRVQIEATVARNAQLLELVLHGHLDLAPAWDIMGANIRCDCFLIEALARILRVRKPEIHAWNEKKWLRATTRFTGKRLTHIITPESFRALYMHHLHDLLEQKRVPNVALFEAFYNYCFVPKHTIGTQLLSVRRDKRERAAFAATQEASELDEDEDEIEGGYSVSLGGDVEYAEGVDT